MQLVPETLKPSLALFAGVLKVDWTEAARVTGLLNPDGVSVGVGADVAVTVCVNAHDGGVRGCPARGDAETGNGQPGDDDDAFHDVSSMPLMPNAIAMAAMPPMTDSAILRDDLTAA